MKDNKKIKTKIIICIVLSVIALAGIMFAIFKVVSKAENDRKERVKAEKEITSNFSEFKDNALAFGEESVEYRTWIKDDISKDTIYQYDAWMLSITNMGTYLDNMDKVADMYKKNCINKHYSKTSVQQMCDSFIEAYEEAVNTFVVDIEDFNTKINELKESTNNEDLKEYELKYKKIDLNNDKKYSEIVIENQEKVEETE